MSVRESFVQLFGEQQALAIENAAFSHRNGIHDRTGSDPFKWACLICIGHECVSRPEFRAYHRISVPPDEFKAWARTQGEFASHDGDCDFLSLFCGAYDEYLVKPSDQTN